MKKANTKIQAKVSPVKKKEPTVDEKLLKVGIDIILEKVAECEFLEDIARFCGVSRYALTKWLNDPLRKTMYAGAREAQADKFAQDIIKIADDGINDTYSSDGSEKVDHDVIARSRLRVDARKWLAAKMNPAYRDNVAIEHSGSIALTDMTDDDIRAELSALTALSNAKDESNDSV